MDRKNVRNIGRDGVKKVTRTFRDVVVLVFKYFMYSFALAILYYTIFAFCVSTDLEKKLHQENKLFESTYADMLVREKLVEDVINSIQIRDRQVYKDIFYAQAPGLDPINTTDFLASSDTIPDKDIVAYTARKAATLEGKVDAVEADFARVAELYGMSRDSLPPLSLPLDGISYAQVGASTGMRLNPFYKVQASHGGVDMIAPQGDPVLASADGVVSKVERSHKGEGNVVEITHKGGYVTRYCHLGDVFVSQGQQVRRGKRVGEIGISGNSLVPHLHYEVLRAGVSMDPVQYFFASVTPDEYANMLYMSVNTGQSLD